MVLAIILSIEHLYPGLKVLLQYVFVFLVMGLITSHCKLRKKSSFSLKF